eukprot:1195766-Prorocentrum_minimum.AAC.1
MCEREHNAGAYVPRAELTNPDAGKPTCTNGTADVPTTRSGSRCAQTWQPMRWVWGLPSRVP